MTMLFAVIKNDNIILQSRTIQEARAFLATPRGKNGIIMYSKRAREMYQNGELSGLPELKEEI